MVGSTKKSLNEDDFNHVLAMDYYGVDLAWNGFFLLRINSLYTSIMLCKNMNQKFQNWFKVVKLIFMFYNLLLLYFYAKH
jgi:hypothetical protein